MRNNYRLKFSIPNGMNSDSTVYEDASLENSPYLGTWKVTEITFADESFTSRMEEDAELWGPFFKGMLGSFENIYLVFSESGEWHYRSNDGTKTGKWTETETGVKIGDMLLAAEGNKLFWEIDDYLLYWEKVSDSQAVPET